MRTINTEFYGDDSRWFIGVVSQIGDIRNLGRVRVRIFGIHNEDTAKVKISDLPWASVVVPVTQGGVSGSTMPDGIQVGAQVYGIFLDGKHSQSPLVLGSIPHDSGLRVVVDEQPDPYVQPKISKPTNNTDETGNVIAGSGALKMSLIGASRLEQAFNYLKQYFQSKGNISNPGNCAAAFIGNFMHETTTDLKPNKNEDKPLIAGSKGGFGIAQWTGPRRTNLINFANSIPGASYASLEVQLAFVVDELEDPKAQRGRTYNKLIHDSTILNYTETVLALYETPETVLDFNSESNFLNYYLKYARAGGIRNVDYRVSRQSLALKAYKAEFEKRLASAKFVSSKFGDR
tara:strand:+ start:517 stop:1554 length:1038 start_codon:yes stop_codon:yes gene_type:complete